MKNKRGFLFSLMLAVIIVLGVAVFFFYSQLKEEGIKVSSGDIVLDLDLENSNLEIKNSPQADNNIKLTNFSNNFTETSSKNESLNFTELDIQE
jgi:hypothetical protein